jgi:hypothetical protein
MLHGELDVPPHQVTNRSRLGESLRRLQRNVEQTLTTAAIAEKQFDEWRARWYERREQISQRLELLDRQLQRLIQGEVSRPQLSLVAVHAPDE